MLPLERDHHFYISARSPKSHAKQIPGASFWLPFAPPKRARYLPKSITKKLHKSFQMLAPGKSQNYLKMTSNLSPSSSGPGPLAAALIMLIPILSGDQSSVRWVSATSYLLLRQTWICFVSQWGRGIPTGEICTICDFLGPSIDMI